MIMTPKTSFLTCVAALALGFAGCSQKEPDAVAADDANKAAATTSDAASRSAEITRVEGTKADDAAKAVETAKAADAAKALDNPKADGLIDKARGLVAEQKFSDALGVLQQLAGQTLSGAQQKRVDGLKEEIQKALAAKTGENAAGTVEGLLKK